MIKIRHARPISQVLAGVAFLFLGLLFAVAEPTASREWTSTAGTKVQAVAEGIKDGTVDMTTEDGRRLKVPLASLIESDQAFLREHFKPSPPKGLPYPVGEVSGPHKAEDGIAWITKLKESEPHRAYYWCAFLPDTYRVGGANARVVESLASELGRDPVNLKYAKGIDAINEFSKKHYTGFGFGSRNNHVTPQIKSAASVMLRDYDGVPFVGEVCRELGEPTVK